MQTQTPGKMTPVEQAFSDALLRLLETERYEDISVSQLCQASGYSRQTFYTLFQSKENVLRCRIDRSGHFPEALVPLVYACKAEALAQVLAGYVEADFDFLKLLVDRDLIFIFYECCRNWLEARKDAVFAAVEPEVRPYMTAYVVGTFVSTLPVYLSSARNSESLETIFRELFSGTYFT